MFSPRLLVILVAAVCPAFADKPLNEIAEKEAGKLPKGGLVTGESIAGVTRFEGVGKLEPDGIAPEKRVFEIGSITKVFTGLLLADAVEAKKVRLDSTLKELLGDEVTFADPDVAAITLVQLSTHTSGLPRLPDNMGWFIGLSNDPYKKYDRKDALKFLAKAELDHAPPFPASYSNYGVGLLGELLSGIQQKSYADLVAEKITGPLGMKDTVVVLDKDQVFGTVTAGKQANLVLLDANPVDSLENFTKIYRVINRGIVFNPDSLVAETPAALAQRQLNAYNMRNIEAFLEPYAEDVEIYTYPNTLLGKGKDVMRKNYAAMFESTPNLHCEVLGRIVQGNVVIDKERV
ncbi:MAG: hypothetical protein EOP83_12755, partial [Verrucomicrobiaceae bacterium]